MNGPRGTILVVTLLALSAACSRGTGGGQQGVQATSGQDPSLFTVASQQLSQLRIAHARTVAWTAETATTGTVDWDADHTTQAITQASGPISRIVVDLGQRVKAGQPLLYVSSPDLATAVSTYRKAANRLDLARHTLDRNRDLLEHKVIAQKDFEGSQADYNDAFTELQNDLEALRILGMTGSDIEEAQRQNVAIRPELAVRSPLAGVVVQKLVMPGQLIQAGATTCFVISDTSTMWVQGHIHDDELTAVHVGDEVEVRNPATPTVFRGRVSYVGAMLDPATRTTPVRVVTVNRDGWLKKDQFVDLLIHGRAREDVLTVPASSVLRTSENLPFVYLQVQPGRFARTVVRLGAQRGDQVEVLSGLHDGDPVVADGAVFLQFAESYER